MSVADECNDTDGAVQTANLIPAGARAVAYNVTIDRTDSAGFLSINPGDVLSSGSSTINWSASNLILANAGIVRLDGLRQLKVFCGGVGSTHFLIDITGYYL